MNFSTLLIVMYEGDDAGHQVQTKQRTVFEVPSFLWLFPVRRKLRSITQYFLYSTLRSAHDIHPIKKKDFRTKNNDDVHILQLMLNNIFLESCMELYEPICSSMTLHVDRACDHILVA